MKNATAIQIIEGGKISIDNVTCGYSFDGPVTIIVIKEQEGVCENKNCSNPVENLV